MKKGSVFVFAFVSPLVRQLSDRRIELMVLKTATPAEQGSLQWLKNSWSGCQECSQWKLVGVEPGEETMTPDLCPLLELQSVIEADGTFQRQPQPCLLFRRLLHSVTFCSPMERLSLILLPLNLGELMTALSSTICTGCTVWLPGLAAKGEAQHGLLGHFYLNQATFYKNKINMSRMNHFCIFSPHLYLWYISLSSIIYNS